MRSGPLFDPTFTGWRYDIDHQPAHRAELLATSDAIGTSLLRAATAPEYLDLAPWFQTRNQGQVGSCRGHSLAGCAEVCHHLAAGSIDLDGDGASYEPGKIDDRFSPQWCYIETQKIDGLRGDVGSSIGGGVKLATTRGIARELVCPYRGTYTREIPAEAEADAAKFKIGRHDFFENPDRLDDLKTWILTGQGPVDIGISWPPRFDSNFIIHDYRGGRGGHAIFICGFIKHPVTEEPVFAFENSHSDSAQANGRFYMTPSALADYLAASFTVAVGLSDLSVAKPRAVNWRRPLI